MIYDYKNKKINFESPDDCPYCKARGWESFPGTTFE